MMMIIIYTQRLKTVTKALYTKYEVSTFLRRYERYEKCKNWGGLGLGVTQGHR